ncbi:MAG: hypothetical protein M0Z90_02550 [Desulfobacteraceae bacterium]|nr:hypothetical protein [Desulfobacteraceae bacterium]
MTNQEGGIQPPGEKLRKAIKWLGEMAQSDSGQTRRQILEQAEIRFNLSPRECEFLNENFAELPPRK